MSSSFHFGVVSVPDGACGSWAIETFNISEQEASFHNLRCLMNRRFAQEIRPGTYRRLRHAQRGTVMSNTPMEVETHQEAFHAATGHVLINGLGMGMILEAVLTKPEVTAVRVVEVDADVLALVGPHFSKDSRVTLVHADARTYRPERGVRFDFVWHDIWDDINLGNLPEMKQLTRKYARRSTAQGVWSRSLLASEPRRRAQPRF